jgi:hypothetical protein
MLCTNPSCLLVSQQAVLSPSRLPGGRRRLASPMAPCAMASAQPRACLHPSELGAAGVAALGAKAGRERAGLARAGRVAIPRGRVVPLGCGRAPLRRGRALSPRGRRGGMALHVRLGSFHPTGSTPGVFRPGLSGTRLPARAWALHEGGSRWCTACLVGHVPSLVALTLRAGSRRTGALTVCQGRAGPVVERWETAPADDAAGLCRAPGSGSARCLVQPPRRDVSSLARRVRGQPVAVP